MTFERIGQNSPMNIARFTTWFLRHQSFHPHTMARRRKSKPAARARKPRSWHLPRPHFKFASLGRPFAALSGIMARTRADTLRQSLIGLSWVAAIAGMVAAWVIGVPRLQASASHERFSYNITVRFLNPPRWFNGDLADHLRQTAEINLGGDPLRRDDLVACRDALLQTGWFESIKQVRRVNTDVVEIDGQFCRPYTVVRDAEGDHLVDVVGRLLPLKYEHGAKTNFTAISGTHFPRPQVCGEVWEGADVIAGIRLLQLIEQQSWRHQVVEIDVSGHVRGESIRLKTDSGAAIVWGGAPGEEPALEVLADGKVKRLNFLFEKYGRIDAGETSGELDITNEKAVVTR
jgi:hypothetical protein